MTTTATRRTTAPEPGAKPAAKKSTPKRVTVTGGTFDATKAATHKCGGACGMRLPVKKFPTTRTAGMRVVECRSCRDARYRAATPAATKETAK